MRKKSFRKVFATRSREAVLLLGRLPLSDANRGALETAALKASVEALLASNPRLVRACHDVAVLASPASGPGIPEGPARLKFLRAALRRAEWAALRRAEWTAGFAEESPLSRPGARGRNYPGCPFEQTFFLRGRIPLRESLLERARSLGTGLRILRFRPRDLRGKPGELAEKLAEISIRGSVLGLYALTGRRPGSCAREFALFVPDSPSGAESGFPEADPLRGLPSAGLLRTLLPPGENRKPDLRGLELLDALPSWEDRGKGARGKGPGLPDAPARDVPSETSAPGASKFPRGSTAARAVRDGARLEGEYRNATVLCAEVPVFTEAFRGLDPGASAELLNLVLSRFSRCAEAQDGVVDAFVGGLLYAFWGAPAATGRDAAAAADAALAMRQALRALNQDRASAGRPPVRMRAGLDSSPVLAGLLGSPKRRSYTAAGEAVRRAGRIGALNPALGTDILVSDYTLRLMGNGFLLNPADALREGPRGEPVPVHVLLGRRGDPGCPPDLKALRKLLGTGT